MSDLLNFENVPGAFFDFGINHTFAVIATLIDQTEASIEANINLFRSQGTEVVEHEISPEDNIFHVVEYYMGLDSVSVDLDEMFTSYYPSVTRRSVFLTLYGLLEHDFEKLCNGFARVHDAPIKLSDLRNSGFERCDVYARKIIGMPLSTHYAMVKKVTRLRNACAHNDAQFFENDNQPINALMDLTERYPAELKRVRGQVQFNAGSLQALTALLRSYFNDVEEAVKAHLPADPFEHLRE